MTPLDHCRASLDDAITRLRAAVPPGPERRLLTLLRAHEAVIPSEATPPAARPGWNLALRLCLEADAGAGNSGADANSALSPAWAECFLTDCDQVALAELALARRAWGHLRLQQRDTHAFVAWATTRRLPIDQRERADFDWWSALLTRQAAPHLEALEADRPGIVALLGNDARSTTEMVDWVGERPEVDRFYRQLGQAHLARFACQHSYPAAAEIGGATFGEHADILALLIGWLLRERGRSPSDSALARRPWNEPALIAALAGALDADPAVIGRALQRFILDRDNAGYHGAPLNRAAPPLIRLDERRLIPSALGLLGEPFVFLTRELRRRHAREYHNSAHLREHVFRMDLYRLFADRRFILSPGRVELKRSGEARTDLDALVFDRKTGTLGIGEPDRRAAWGSWPQAIQLVGPRPFGPDDHNPLASLFARLRGATHLSAPTSDDARTIAIGDLRLHIYPSFAAMEAAEAELA